MANLDSLRRRLALEEEAPVEGGFAATTPDERLAQFAAMDAQEEANAASRGMSVDDLRFAKRQKQREQEYLDTYGLPMETKPFVQVPPSMRSPQTKAEEPSADFASLVERAMASRKQQGLPPTGVDFASLQRRVFPGEGEVMIPTAMQPPESMSPQQQRARSRSASGFEVPMERLRESVDMPEIVPSLAMPSGVPAKTSDFASLQKLISQGSLASPIPIASAPASADVSAPVTGAIDATTSTQPAPSAAGTAGGVKPPPVVETAGAGGDMDEMGRLSLGQALVRALEGSGSIIAGRDLRSGAAETLGERMKQIEALRAKREERSMELAREDAQSAALVQQYKSLAAQGLMPPIEGLDMMPVKQAASLIKTYASLPGLAERAKKTQAEIPLVEARVGDVEAGAALKRAKTVEVPLEGESKREERKARIAKIYKDMEVAGAKLALDERKTLEQAQQAKDPFKKLESLNTIADKKEFGGFTTLAGDLADLERTAPGFVTRGEVPEWLTREQQLLGQNWPSSTDPRVVEFLSKYGKVANEERHRQYGSAQTDGELRSFMQQLNSSPLSAGPQVLARQVKSFADAAGRVAKGRLSRYNNVFGAENVDTVLGPEWKPLFDAGGVFAAQGTPFKAVVQTPASKTTQAGMTRMTGPDGQRYDVPNDKVEAAKAKGWKE